MKERDLRTARPRPTMRDVAALAGVSLRTVSRVVNEEPSVDPVLAGRVRAASQKLGYRPNLIASSLRRLGGRTQVIGLLVEDVSNPYAASLHRAVEDVAREHGMLLLTGSLDEDPERERATIRTLIDRRVDGLIIMPTIDNYNFIVNEIDTGTSFVFVDRLPTPLVADTIVIDNRGSVVQGVTHLIDKGHRRIAYLGDSLNIVTARHRREGYLAALERAGLTYDDDLVIQDVRSPADAFSATCALLTMPSRPSAIFASQNMITVGAVEAIHRQGLNHEMAIVGFDDFPLAGVMDPGVTLVAQQPSEMGRLAAERLLARLNGDSSPARVWTLETELIERGSGEISPPRSRR